MEEFDARIRSIFARGFPRRDPTAVNLFWAIDRMRGVYSAVSGARIDTVRSTLVREAQHDPARGYCDAMRRSAAIWGRASTGRQDGPDALQCRRACDGRLWTALGVIRAAVRRERSVDVSQMRHGPFLQGARLTVWELAADHIPATLITEIWPGIF